MFVHYVYQLRRADSSKPFYIGKGKGSRYLRHTTSYLLKGKSRKINAIKSAINDGVEVISEILVAGLTDERAREIEVGLISLYGRRDLQTGILTNMTDGGEGLSGQVRSAEWRKHRSHLMTGRVASEETKKKMSESHKKRVRLPRKLKPSKFLSMNYEQVIEYVRTTDIEAVYAVMARHKDNLPLIQMIKNARIVLGHRLRGKA